MVPNPLQKLGGDSPQCPQVEQRMIVSIRCHLPTKHAQMGAGFSSAIILDKLRCLELGWHNDLRKIGQTI